MTTGNQILRIATVEGQTGLSVSTIYAKLNPKSKYHDPSFPRPIKLGGRAVGWRASDLEGWIESLGATA